MDVDEILRHVGQTNKFHIILEILLCASLVPTTMTILIPYFAQYNPSWRCVGRNSSICNMKEIMTPSHPNYQDRCRMSRSEWMFTEPKDYSIVTQFDLYCDTEIYSYIATSLTFVFWAIGAVVIGWITDRFGRVMVIVVSGLVIIIVGLISAFSVNFWMYATCRAVIGFFIPGSIVQLFIFAAEYFTTEYRPVSGLLLGASFTVGLVMLGVKAYFIRKWKILIIVCSAPYAIISAIFYKFVPESVRWLHANGKSEQLVEVVKKIQRINGKTPTDITVAPIHREKMSKPNPLDIFRPTKVAISTLIQSYGWFVNGMVYYGISLAADDLGGSMYRDYILASLVEFPALAVAIYTCKRFGRKKTITIPMFIGSTACIVVSLIPSGSGTSSHWIGLRVGIGMIGKFCVAASFNSIYIWSSELYPTLTRAIGVGFLQITCRTGSALAPWIAKWLKVFHIVLPFAVMGGSTFISAITLLWLPETGFTSLPDVLEHSEKASHIENGAIELEERKMIPKD